MPLYAAWPMFEEILKHHSSHCYATLADWAWIPDAADRILYAFTSTPTAAKRMPDWQRADDGANHATRSKPHDQQARRALNKRLGIT